MGKILFVSVLLNPKSGIRQSIIVFLVYYIGFSFPLCSSMHNIAPRFILTQIRHMDKRNEIKPNDWCGLKMILKV